MEPMRAGPASAAAAAKMSIDVGMAGAVLAEGMVDVRSSVARISRARLYTSP